MRHLLIALLALLLATPLTADPSAAGWRVDGSGRFPKVTSVNQWSAERNVIWKTKMPSWSNATPVCVGEHLYLCAEPDQLLCVGLNDGKLQWQAKSTSTEAQLRTHRANGYTSATPVTDGEHLWCVFGSGIAACYDLKGKKVWSRMISAPRHKFGHSASPVLVDGTVFVHIESVLFALAADTGKERWQAKTRMAWGSPAPTTVGKVKVLVMASGDVIDCATGKTVASGLGRLTYGTPVIEGDVAYFIDPRATAVKLESDGAGGVKTSRLWSLPELAHRRARFYASPVIHDGLIYALEQRGTLIVLEAATGKEAYRERLAFGRGTCYPSLVLAGKVMHAGSDNGTTFVFRPGKSYTQIAKNTLEMTRACAIFVGNRMIVRGYNTLYCIGNEGAQKDPKTAEPEKREFKLDPNKEYY